MTLELPAYFVTPHWKVWLEPHKWWLVSLGHCPVSSHHNASRHICLPLPQLLLPNRVLIIWCCCLTRSRLRKLGLCGNGLSDKGVQRLTTPLRMFRKGPVSLHTLDLSGEIQQCRSVDTIFNAACLFPCILCSSGSFELEVIFSNYNCYWVCVSCNLKMLYFT